jgi:hypothetical protein
VSERYDLSRLRAAFAQPDDPPYPDRCPSASEIWDGVHGHLPARRLREVVEHLASCSPCAEAWRMALALERPAGAEDGAGAAAGVAAERPAWAGAAPGSRFRPGWRLYGAVATAAAAVFAVVLGTHDFRRGQPPPVVIAQRGGAAAPRTATQWLTLSDSVLPPGGARLRWSGPPGAIYDLTVELVDERGAERPILIAAPRGLASTEYALPARDLRGSPRLSAGAHLKATLVAHLADGRSESLFRDFRLR